MKQPFELPQIKVLILSIDSHSGMVMRILEKDNAFDREKHPGRARHDARVASPVLQHRQPARLQACTGADCEIGAAQRTDQRRARRRRSSGS